MKENIKFFLSILSKIKSHLFGINKNNKDSSIVLPAMFYRSSFSCKGRGNSLAVSGKIEKSMFFINGVSNAIDISMAEITGTIITVSGHNNSIHFDAGVILRGSVVTIRGNGCSIKIGKASSFGGVRIISAGLGNLVTIGSGCLFADFIEIWASDTHPIYNEQKEIINTEKPIFIGDKVWVGARAIILKGSTIGSGSIVGMGTLVTNPVPPSCITVGNPNRIVKEGVSWSLHY